MNNNINAILIREIDDVATGIVEFHRGDLGRYRNHDERLEVVIIEDVPKFHKFAVRDIRKGDLVRKYGEIIGEATQDIRKGCFVHDHNLTSPNQRITKLED